LAIDHNRAMDARANELTAIQQQLGFQLAWGAKMRQSKSE